MRRRGHGDALSVASGAPARPLLVALAVLGGAVLVVVGLLLGAALTSSSGSAGPAGFPDEASVDAGFARDMQVHHGQAVEMSVLVRDRSDDAEVRGIALDIMLTQQNQQGQMAGWLQTWGLRQSSTLPTTGWMTAFGGEGTDGMAGMDMGEATAGASVATAPENPMVAMGLATQAEVATLTEADGEDAERLYLQLMIDHHRGGVEMAGVAAQEATQPQVRRLAESMVLGQSSEIERLDELLEARGGPLPG